MCCSKCVLKEFIIFIEFHKMSDLFVILMLTAAMQLQSIKNFNFCNGFKLHMNLDIDDGDDNRGDLSNDTRRAVKEIADILKTFG